MNPQSDDIQKWATEGAGEGEPASSSSNIRDFIEQEISSMGTLHTDMSTVPATSNERPNGTFFDLNDLIRYLDGGGLLFRDTDGTFVPNPIVNILRVYDEDDDLYYYTAYIDDETP